MDRAIVEVSEHSGRASTAIVLPCGPDQFSQFIAGLLGRSQELTAVRSGAFAVTKADALQVHHLLVQRVDQQHGVRPLQFTAQVSYDDGTNVLVNSIEEFESYSEVRALRSIGLVFTWTFLLNFPGKPTPEKQEVEFSFGVQPRRLVHQDQAVTFIANAGTLSYRIKHTARTWGSDIESMLTHYMNTLIQPQSSIRSGLKKYSTPIAVAVGISFFVAFMGGFGYVNNRVLEEQSALLVPMLGDKVSMTSKLDGIISFLSISRDSLRSIYSTVYIIVAAIGSIAAAGWIGTQVGLFPPSGVLLTRRAEETYAIQQKHYSDSLWKVCLSLMLAIVLGIFVNVVYDFPVKKVVQDLVERTTQKR